MQVCTYLLCILLCSRLAIEFSDTSLVIFLLYNKHNTMKIGSSSSTEQYFPLTKTPMWADIVNKSICGPLQFRDTLFMLKLLLLGFHSHFQSQTKKSPEITDYLPYVRHHLQCESPAQAETSSACCKPEGESRLKLERIHM